MRNVIFSAITFATLSLSYTAALADGPWCAYYRKGGGTNCGFYSFSQCLATVSGVGGYCAQNPVYTGRRRSRDW